MYLTPELGSQRRRSSVADRSMLSQDTHVSDLPRARTRLLIPAADAGILPPFSAARFECSCLQTSLLVTTRPQPAG